MADGQDNVVVLDIVTRLDIPAERVLRAALEADLQNVVVVGFTQDGEEYFCSSIADAGTVNWHLDRAKLKLLRLGEG